MSQELRKEIYNHLAVSLTLFILIEIFWLIGGIFSFLRAGKLFIGLLLGTFVLDADHLVYWFFLYPNLGESQEAKKFWQQGKWRQLLALLAQTHKSHTSLIFHHFIFQAALTVLTVFILTSTVSVFGQGLILAIDAHLLTDQWLDWRQDPRHLQKWLFARTPLSQTPLPFNWLKNYLFVYSFVLGVLIYVAGH